MNRRLSRSTDSRRGATAVEFALVAPIFFMVLIASIEISRLNVIRNTADHAAYEAARTGLVPGGTADEAVAAANQLLSVIGTRGAQIVITPAVLTDETREIQVDIAIPFNRNALLVPRFIHNGVVSASSTLRTERVVTIGSS